MTVAQIIGQIGALPQEDRQKVFTFTRRMENEKPLSAEELTALAAELVSCDDTSKEAQLREQLVKGFYGDQ